MSTRLGLKPLTGLGASDGFRASAMRSRPRNAGVELLDAGFEGWRRRAALGD
jgi:hypothetical protein